MLRNVGLDALRVRGEKLVGASGSGPIDSIRDLFAPLVDSGDTFDWIVLALTFLGVVASVRERAFRLHALAILGYLTSFFVLYAGSGLAVGMNGHWFLYLRTSSLWFFATMLAAAAIAALSERFKLVLVALVLLLAAGVFDLVQVARTGTPARPIANLALLARTRGYEYVQYFDKLTTHLSGDDHAKVATLLHYRDDSNLLPASIAHSLFEKSTLPLDLLIDGVERDFGARADQALLGLGHYLHPTDGYDIPAALAELESAPPAWREILAEAVGRAGLGPRFRRERLDEQIALAIDPAWRAPFLRGTGFRVYNAYLLDPLAAEDFLARQSNADRAELRAGYEAARAANTLP
jgi:hypothetical protein